MRDEVELGDRVVVEAEFDGEIRLQGEAERVSAGRQQRRDTPTSAAREPVKAIQASRTKRLSSSRMLRAVWIVASAAVIAFSRSGRTTKTVIAKIAAATKK